jgi:hypothetical protein
MSTFWDVLKEEAKYNREMIKNAIYPSSYYFIIPFIVITLFCYIIFYNKYNTILKQGGIRHIKYSSDCQNRAYNYCNNRNEHFRSKYRSTNTRSSRCLNNYKIHNCKPIYIRKKLTLNLLYFGLPLIISAIIGGIIFRIKFCSLSPKVCIAQSLY